jgi:hypothetical protein
VSAKTIFTQSSRSDAKQSLRSVLRKHIAAQSARGVGQIVTGREFVFSAKDALSSLGASKPTASCAYAATVLLKMR